MAKIYLEAGRVVEDVLSGHCGLKAALYAKQLSSDPRAVCKLASCTLAQKAALAEALERVGLVEHHSRGVMLVMAFELLLGHGLRGGGKLRRQLEGHQKSLQAVFRASTKSEVGSEASAFAALPRYVRLNRLQVPDSDDDLKERLKSALLKAYELDLAAGRKVTPEMAVVQQDELVPEVLVLHPASRSWLQKIPDVGSGALILQDRSSCLSALAAGLVPGDFVVDSCAAPGSKTAHAIELLRADGHLAAFERDPKRAAALVKRLQQLVGLSLKKEEKKKKKKRRRRPEAKRRDDLKLGSRVQGRARVAASGEGVEVEVHVGDFLETSPAAPPWNRVDVLIVDPSCSGTGLPEHHLVGGRTESGQSARVRRLAAFQKRILSHALSFPSARKLGSGNMPSSIFGCSFWMVFSCRGFVKPVNAVGA